MARPTDRFGGAASLLLVGLVFHVLYVASIFDIYFVSPVVHVSRRFSALDVLAGEARVAQHPPADRLVLFVGDGLRADKLFSVFPKDPFSSPIVSPILTGLVSFEPSTVVGRNETTPAPYLRSLLDSGTASWGVSHTRVPTESRPGHVALIAGMYEDVSAVTRGWKMNPVAFDSVFNQSSHTFSFGSPDILPMFKHGASPPSRVDAYSYDESDEDFTKDALELDIWVLDHLRTLLAQGAQQDKNSELQQQLRGQKTVFFLHLLGLDTTGHSYRPHSPEYYRNLELVDKVVQASQKSIEDFFDHDGRTAYIFTADHGMSNIGNHGDGDPMSTRTPLMAWGSGVLPSKKLEPPAFGREDVDDPYFQNWKLEQWERKDVEQADVTALMAALIGIHVPGNSVGRLPSHYIDGSDDYQARAALANSQAILEQYRVKHRLKSSNTIRYVPFAELPEFEDLKYQTDGERLFWINRLILAGRYEEAIKSCIELEDVALRGMKYLQTYDWALLQTIVVAGYTGWILYSAKFVLEKYSFLGYQAQKDGAPSIASVAIWLGCILLMVKFALERAPFTYFLYAISAAYLWACNLTDFNLYQLALMRLGGAGTFAVVLGIGASIQSMVIGYFKRESWSVGWIILGWMWPMFSFTQMFRQQNAAILLAWRIATTSTSIFTLLPVEKGENLLTIFLGAAIFGLAGLIAKHQKRGAPTTAQLIIIVIATLVTMHSASRLQLKQGLPLLNQMVGRLIVVLSPLTARSHNGSLSAPTWMTDKILRLAFAMAPIFVILSISYEILFLFSFSASLLVWLELESRLADPESRVEGAFTQGTQADQSDRKKHSDVVQPLRASHLRLALFFLFYIHVGFFGTGNIASISSFYLEPVYRLVPVFNPFLMASLLLFKIMIPFLLVSAVFTAVNRRLKLPKFSLFVCTLTVSDLLTLQFFFLVRDTGSWLEIGQSISHFVIASLLLVFMIVLHWVGDGIVGDGSMDRH